MREAVQAEMDKLSQTVENCKAVTDYARFKDTEPGIIAYTEELRRRRAFQFKDGPSNFVRLLDEEEIQQIKASGFDSYLFQANEIKAEIEAEKARHKAEMDELKGVLGALTAMMDDAGGIIKSGEIEVSLPNVVFLPSFDEAGTFEAFAPVPGAGFYKLVGVHRVKEGGAIPMQFPAELDNPEPEAGQPSQPEPGQE